MKIYPAFFLPEENGGFTVSFPDIPGAVTWGATFEEAYNYAQEVLGFALENEETGRFDDVTASELAAVRPEEGEFVVAVPFDEIEYLKRYSTKSVRKNLTIPRWLNALAEKENINFSRTLREALKAKLHVV